MILEYIFIGFFAVVFIFILAVYLRNSAKMNKKNKKEIEKKKVEEKKKEEETIEIKAEQSAEKPVEKAIKEANIEYQIKEAFERIEQERVEFESTSKIKTIGGKLQLDRGDFKTELQKSLETNKISSDTNVISSATQKMDYEIKPKTLPNIAEDYTNDVDKQIAEDYMKNKENQNKTLGDQIKDLSPEVKAILVNDVLNRKY